ncbi:threonine/serine exporter family protein [Paenibacillus koleovorans]|uniref:threonine/serine exporter family protein n=1 Tax=Paenibacillus koleovorans TaxID=121608 RepID=UPI000FD90D46|nr:threonine/serine exporter family protein [Paenibacillus koleovorans]
MIDIAEQLLVSFAASAAFAVLFHAPRASLLHCGFVGALGWVLYVLLLRVPADPVLAALLASFFVAVLSQLFARTYKAPVIIFIVAGIIPLVPGGMAYDAMRNIVENQYDQAVQLGAKAFMLSGAIAIGIVFSEVLTYLSRRPKG